MLRVERAPRDGAPLARDAQQSVLAGDAASVADGIRGVLGGGRGDGLAGREDHGAAQDAGCGATTQAIIGRVVRRG